MHLLGVDEDVDHVVRVVLQHYWNVSYLMLATHPSRNSRPCVR